MECEMLPKSRRPREKRIVPLARITYSIAQFCEKTGLSREAVLKSIDDGRLRIMKLGKRRLILAGPPSESRAENRPSPVAPRH